MTELIRLFEGDSVEVLATIPEHTYTCFVTDPPYGLGPAPPWEDVIRQWTENGDYVKRKRGKVVEGKGFLGAKWDAFVPGPKLWSAVYRVCRPGAIGLVFASDRTDHWMKLALVMAGFEVLTTLGYCTSMGMPKAGTIDKRIDKRLGAERPVIGKHPNPAGNRRTANAAPVAPEASDEVYITTPGSPEAMEWAGWSTTLAPALEPIIVVRRPCEGTATANILKHGCGAFHIDACRVPSGAEYTELDVTQGGDHFSIGSDKKTRGTKFKPNADGRWPKTLLLDEQSAEVLDDVVGERKSGSRAAGVRKGMGYMGADGDGGPAIEGSTGGPSRFFPVLSNDSERWDWVGPLATAEDTRLPIKYTTKVSKRERNAGMPEGKVNGHPTLKGCEKRDSIMRWLCRLVGHPKGRGLDPFAGSASTLRAARHEGLPFDGIERDPHYARDLALPRSGVARLTPWRPEGIAATDPVAQAKAERPERVAVEVAIVASLVTTAEDGLPTPDPIAVEFVDKQTVAPVMDSEEVGRVVAEADTSAPPRTAEELVAADLEDRCCMLVARGVCGDATLSEVMAIRTALRARAAELGVDDVRACDAEDVSVVRFVCSWDGSDATVTVARTPHAHPGEVGLHRAAVDVRVDRPGRAAEVADVAVEWPELVALLLHRGDVLDAAPERCEHAVRP